MDSRGGLALPAPFPPASAGWAKKGVAQNMDQRRAFTLIELLIVIGLLGALAALMLPTFRMRRVESLGQIVDHDMAEIRRAFRRFYGDAVLLENDLEMVRRWGLGCLAERPDGTHEGWVVPDFDMQKRRGWRGPYLAPEGRRHIDGDEDAIGQPAGAVEVPVVEDPFSASDSDGHYYRVVAPVDTDGNYVYHEMLLVCVGANGRLDIALPVLAAGETLDPDLLVDGTDDTTVRLCPYVD